MSTMPTWMQRLKFFLGWNEAFKYPECKTRMSAKEILKPHV